MTSVTASFPPAGEHGQVRRLFDDVFFVSGAITMRAPVKMAFSRNMTVIKDGETLTLVNTMRLDEAGLDALDALGKVEHIIRLAGFHGMDDPFYKDRYGADVWAVKGQRYTRGFEAKPDSRTYFDADVAMTADTDLPVAGARLHVIDGLVPEGLLVLERHGGIVVAGDCLQNWHRADSFFSFGAKVSMKLMGFIKAHNVGPGWLRGAKPNVQHVKNILEIEFEHVLPSHGSEVINDAKAKYRPAIQRLG